MNPLTFASKNSYDWLETTLSSVCVNAFPSDPSLHAAQIEPRVNRLFPHKEYNFVLESSDTSFRLILRLYQALFSLWSGTEDLKASKEYSVLRHTYKHGIPTAFPYCFSPSLKPFGNPYLIIDAGDGVPWWETEDSLSMHQDRLVDMMAEHLARIHLVVEPKHPLIPSVDVQSVIRNLWYRVKHLGNDELSLAFDVCLHRISVQDDVAPVLLHGCFDLDHVLIQNEKLRTIIHWEHAAIGDPRWDVAYTALSLQNEGDRSLSNRFVAKYVQLTGNPLEDLNVWEGLVALRGFALCHWIQSLDKRSFQAVAGMASDLNSIESKYRRCVLRQFV